MTAHRRLSFLLRPEIVLGAIVVLGALLSWRHTRNAHEWIVMTDELQYLDLARSFGDGSFPIPTLRGEHHPLLSFLYPLLIAPVLALSSAPDGYQHVHAVNALLISSTAIPVYLLARQVVDGRWPAYLAGALSVAVPWAATSAVVMTEAAAYPAFAWALLAIQRALVEPSWRRDAVAIAAIGLAFFARTQFLFLAGVFPALIVMHEALFVATARDSAPGRRAKLRLLGARLRPHAPLGVLVVVGLLALFPGQMLGRLLGPFELTVNEGGPFPVGLTAAMRTQLTYVVGGLGFLPLALALGWALASLVRPLDRRSHAFAVLALLVGVALTYVVAVFGLRHAEGPADRYLFYVAPLVLVGAVALLAQGRVRPLGLIAGAAFTFWLLRTAGIRFVPESGYVNSQASDFHRVIGGQVARLGGGVTPVALLSFGTLAATAVVALALRRWPRHALALVGGPLLVLAVLQTDYVSRVRTAFINAGYGAANAYPLADRDWIDQALPGDGDVALAPSPLAELNSSQRIWWNTEYWNKRVNRSIVLNEFQDYAPFPYESVALDKRDGSLRTSDGNEPRFMVFGRNQLVFRPRGRVIAERKTTTIPQDPGLELLDVERPYRAQWVADGPTEDGWIVRTKPAEIRVFPREDGQAQRLRLSLNLPSELAAAPSRFVVRSGGQVLQGKAEGTFDGIAKLTLCLPPGRRRDVSISTRADRRLPQPDGRRVGVHLQTIRVEPAGRRC